MQKYNFHKGIIDWNETITEQDRFDPVKSADAYGQHMSMLMKKYNGDTDKAVMAYNWGEGNLDRKGVEAAPKETRDYLGRVTGTQLHAPTRRQAKVNTANAVAAPVEVSPVVQQAQSALIVDNRAGLEAQYKADKDAVDQQRLLLAEMQAAKEDGTPKYSSLLPREMPEIQQVAATGGRPSYSDAVKNIKRFVRHKIIHNSQLIVIGHYAFNYLVKKVNKDLDFNFFTYYQAISINYKEDRESIANFLKKEYKDKITIKHFTPFFQFYDYHTEYYYNNVFILKLYGHNNRCIVNNYSEKKKTYYGTFQAVFLYLLIDYQYAQKN
jgi:hypothetical protein